MENNSYSEIIVKFCFWNYIFVILNFFNFVYIVLDLKWLNIFVLVYVCLFVLYNLFLGRDKLVGGVDIGCE